MIMQYCFKRLSQKKYYLFTGIILFCFLPFWLLGQTATKDSSASLAQVSDLQAVHRNGQTFLTWNGVWNYLDKEYGNGANSEISQPEFLKLYKQLRQDIKSGKAPIYHIYRSLEPIDTQTLAQAKLVAKVEPLSVFYPEFYGMYWYDKKFQNMTIPRISIDAQKSLAPQKEVWVETTKSPGTYYYAVLSAIGGKENRYLGAGNVTKKGIEETVAPPQPVLQFTRKINKNETYVWRHGPGEIRYYMTWVDAPDSNRPRHFIWSVAIPSAYDPSVGAALQLSLHAWGANQDTGTYWYKIPPACIRIATVDYPVQDWWYGYREDYQKKNHLKSPLVINYTERRLLSFIDWVRSKWTINPNLIFVEGESMGGSGAMSLGMKRGGLFCYVDSWVGISSWPLNSWFRNGERNKWGEKYQLTNYNGVKFDDWMNLSKWLRDHPKTETPFLTFANGKNDDQIGWKQALATLRALQVTKRPFVFNWGMAGHGQRSHFMMDPEMMAKNKSIPAFGNCSLDNDPGTGKKLATPKIFRNRQGKVLKDAYDGDSVGQINEYLRWSGVKESRNQYEIVLYLDKKAPKEQCTVDMTPRRVQHFKTAPGTKVKWENLTISGSLLQSGEATADQWGLVTLKNIQVSKAKNRIQIQKMP